MKSIRRVWIINVNRMKKEDVDNYIQEFIGRVKGQGSSSEDLFVPVRSQGDVRIIELDRPVGFKFAESTPSPGIAIRYTKVPEGQDPVEYAEERMAETKKKVEDGTYTLDHNGETMLFLPLADGEEAYRL